MRVAVLSSGGKDSVTAAWWAICRGWDVVAFVTVRIVGDDSWMFQIPATEQVGNHARRLGIPWEVVESHGNAEEEVQDLESHLGAMLAEAPFDGIVSGALRSEYQRTRLDRMAHRLNIRSFAPLWHHDPKQHMFDLATLGFDVRVASTSSDGLDDSWVGIRLDVDALNRLQDASVLYRFNLDGEGGEYETTVVDGPLFPAPQG